MTKNREYIKRQKNVRNKINLLPFAIIVVFIVAGFSSSFAGAASSGVPKEYWLWPSFLRSIWDSDEDTGVQTEESRDEDKIRFDTAGVERMIINNLGKVGIGTTNPIGTLEVSGTGNYGGIRISGNGTQPDIFIGDDAVYDWNLHNIRSDGNSNLVIEPSYTTGDRYLILNPYGKVGIGTTSPSSKLEVDGTIHSTSGGFKFPDGTTQTSAATGDGHSLDAADGSPTNVVFVDNAGNVGIGITNPLYKLDVAGILRATKMFDKDNTNYYVDPAGTSKFQTINLGGVSRTTWPTGGTDTDWTILGNDMYSGVSGNVGIGTSTPDAKLTIKGTATENILLKGYNYLGEEIVEIGEGLDYAETFPISQDQISPGTVLVIDTLNPGGLTISTEPYDTKVAGIVSGAMGLGYGVRLGADIADGYPVALAGRVYCNVDTYYGDIKPGDLLTTSPTPGHAMVVKDYSKAPGAILGKAMEELSGNVQGQILVLVTLQ